jgi:hypothetical protein
VSKLEERNRLPNQILLLGKKKEEQIAPPFYESENQ